MRHPDGRLGSGGLAAHAVIGDGIDLRIRRNPGLPLPADGRYHRDVY